jgi:hypothetical protein
MTAGEYEKQLHLQGDNYKQTVLAMKAFANEVLFDDTTRSPITTGTVHCGRTMTTSPANRQSPDTAVHPDLVIQSSPGFGVVGEVKWGLHRDQGVSERQMQETADQLEKYDDDLTGWPLPPGGDGKVDTHDLALLVNHEDSKKVTREIKARLKDGRLRLDRALAVVAFGQFQRAEGIWPELDLEFGTLTDSKKTAKLENRVPIRPEKLETSPVVGLVQLSDCQPPAPVMMELVHKAIVQNLSRDEHEAHRPIVRQENGWPTRCRNSSA